MNASQPIVREELIERCLGDEDFAAEMLGLFAVHAPGLVEQVRSSARAGQWDDACRAAHTLKGTAGNIAAPELRAAATSFEQAVRSGDTGLAISTLPSLELSFEKALAFASMLGQSMARKAA
jgi:HPt (histidine-containing phosphotransfer) domain-containing protein